MEQTNKFQFGPALAIVIIIGVVAVAGLYFYKNTFSDLTYNSASEVVIPEGYVAPGAAPVEQTEEFNTDLSTSTDLSAIGAELEASVEADLSALDDLNEELLNFDDLDDLDFDI